MAEGIIEFVHLMYNVNTADRVLRALIERLTEAVEKKEFRVR